MTRDELITQLVSRGFQAKPRDWVMGETVFVTRVSMQVGSVMALPGATYCWPVGKEFAVLDPPGRELRFPSLDLLLGYLSAHFKSAEEFWSKPQ